MTTLAAPGRAFRQSEDARYIQDCLNGRLGRKRRAAADRVMRYAQWGRFVGDSPRIAHAIRGLAASGRGW